ncbi:MAG: MerR family transcriptional regulator [Acetatifactor sp.]|nr:MerR family transcriptional regulator [Acetatifactor sp.]
MYTIKQVAEKMRVSEHTVRFYAKEGLFPFIKRDKNNVRLFSEKDIGDVATVLCLRDTGMSLQEIRNYMDLCRQGDATISQRLAIIQRQKVVTLAQLAELQRKVEHLECKEKCYKELLHSGENDCCKSLP